MWLAMGREKRGRRHFKRTRFPSFDNEEPPLEYVLDLESSKAIQLDLDGEEDGAIIDWFCGPKPPNDSPRVNEPSYKYWSLNHGKCVPPGLDIVT